MQYRFLIYLSLWTLFSHPSIAKPTEKNPKETFSLKEIRDPSLPTEEGRETKDLTLSSDRHQLLKTKSKVPSKGSEKKGWSPGNVWKSLSKGVKRIWSSSALNRPISTSDLEKEDFDFSSTLDFYRKTQKEEERQNTQTIANDLENIKSTDEKKAYLTQLIQGSDVQKRTSAQLIEMIKHTQSDGLLFKKKWANNVVHLLSNPFLVSFMSNLVGVSTGYEGLGRGITMLLGMTGGGHLRDLYNKTNVPDSFKKLALCAEFTQENANIERDIQVFPRNLFALVLDAYKKTPDKKTLEQNAQQIYEALHKENKKWEKAFQDLLGKVDKTRAQYKEDAFKTSALTAEHSDLKQASEKDSLLIKIKHEEDKKNRLEQNISQFFLDMTQAVRHIYDASHVENSTKGMEAREYSMQTMAGGVAGGLLADPIISVAKSAGDKLISYGKSFTSSANPEENPTQLPPSENPQRSKDQKAQSKAQENKTPQEDKTSQEKNEEEKKADPTPQKDEKTPEEKSTSSPNKDQTHKTTSSTDTKRTDSKPSNTANPTERMASCGDMGYNPSDLKTCYQRRYPGMEPIKASLKEHEQTSKNLDSSSWNPCGKYTGKDAEQCNRVLYGDSACTKFNHDHVKQKAIYQTHCERLIDTDPHRWAACIQERAPLLGDSLGGMSKVFETARLLEDL